MVKREIQIGQHTLSIETGRLAKQSDGGVVVRMGDTMVLVTACHASSPREGIDFLPLTVDYREYTYASGRIPGGFFKREGKATEKETLTCRVIDRPIRPLFAAGWSYETQVIAFVLSADKDHDSDVLALTGASAALALSEMPFEKTIAGVRVGLVDGQYIVNPTFPQRKQSRLDLGGGREQGRDRDGRGRRPGGVGGRSHPRPRGGPRRHQGHLRDDRPARRRGRPEEAAQARGESRCGVPAGHRGPGARAAHRGDAHQGQAGELRHRRQGREGDHRRAARGSGRPQGRGQGHPARPAGEGAARGNPGPRRPARRPQVRRDPADLHREHGAAAGSTARRCSPAARPRRWSPSRSAPPTISRRSRWSTARCGSASCSTTTSRPSRSAR